MDCTGNQKYYLCSAKHKSKNTTDSCVYKKVMSGEDVDLLYPNH